ncbi:MAG: PHA/PHB synthase family protein [Beijerinckiaceae bacterium]
MPDFEALARNLPLIIEESGKALAAAMKPVEEGRTNPDLMEHAADAVQTLGSIAEYWMTDPQRAVQAQAALTTPLLELWGHTWRRLTGEESGPPADAGASADKRFADPQWREHPIYDFLRQAYVITSGWANHMVADAGGVDPVSRDKAMFYLRQITGALSPSNFIPTNPELLRKTLEENGANLVRGLHMMVEDIEAGRGQLKIRQSDSSKFELGRDMATSPGKVVFRNDLMELIQYAPSTESVYKRPLLIVPPWINKFYVLDLNPEKSFVRFCVENGLTVFLVSWVNPDQRHADKSFEDYMREGILGALDAIEAATGERDVTAIGYCVGGTLLAITLAWMAAVGDRRISSATLFTTQVDFTDAGDLKLFVDAARIKALEERMQQTGYLEGAKMAAAFNMLRPNELIWGYFVNNYLKGTEPMPFDLLTWNSDSTRMPAANHSFYLRNCYLENTLARGEMTIAGKLLNLRDVTIPIYNLAAREDHIAPPRSVFTGAKLFGGQMRYVLSGSGHIAGVVNPARKPKYQYWTGPTPQGDFESWVQHADEHPGSWWPDWIEWIRQQAPEQVEARTPGDGKLQPLCDAPGEYVRVKS